MVAERDGVGACGKKFFVNRLRDAEALVGGVLAVDDGKLDLPLGDAARKVSADRFTTCLPDDIADEQNAQDRLLSCRRLAPSDSVRTLTNAPSGRKAVTTVRGISRLAEGSAGDGMDQYVNIEQESQSAESIHYRVSEGLPAEAFQRDQHE